MVVLVGLAMTDAPEVVFRPSDGLQEYVYVPLPPEPMAVSVAELPEQIVALFTVTDGAPRAHAPPQNARASAMTAARLKARASQAPAPRVAPQSLVPVVHPSLRALAESSSRSGMNRVLPQPGARARSH